MLKKLQRVVVLDPVLRSFVRNGHLARTAFGRAVIERAIDAGLVIPVRSH